MTRRQFRLPNGRVTYNKAAYVRAWHKFGQSVCVALNAARPVGWEIYAFDPDISVIDKNGRSMDIPACVAEALSCRTQAGSPRGD